MATMQDKIILAKKLEDFCNTLREEISYLQRQRRTMVRENRDTSKLDDQINSYERALGPAWDNFEILLDEIGSDNYYNHLSRIRFKEMNSND